MNCKKQTKYLILDRVNKKTIMQRVVKGVSKWVRAYTPDYASDLCRKYGYRIEWEPLVKENTKESNGINLFLIALISVFMIVLSVLLFINS